MVRYAWDPLVGSAVSVEKTTRCIFLATTLTPYDTTHLNTKQIGKRFSTRVRYPCYLSKESVVGHRESLLMNTLT